ncbi:sensor histidine kinase [Sphingomonas koreensis]|uniref:sensor histidine kinase n=1 Tax=Sphingomonas koreensis TaxID=93064 RepID=UPI00082A7AB2|nr:sensor histidine kinase [Sphingomonas koreensis]PJI90574.1 histidine kinase/DNA gyrase B/HSP90-like ATPase [Sphingomonas koreensis]
MAAPIGKDLRGDGDIGIRGGKRVGAWLIGALMLAMILPARALDPERKLAQLHHTAWTIEDGAPPDVWALAQSADGFLWLGTGGGLYRFDGVRFEEFRPAPGERLPSANINSLYAAPGGDLWIGFEAGQISRLRGGRLKTFSPTGSGASVFQIAGDRNGGIWAATTSRGQGGLTHFAGGRWTIVGPERGLPPGGVSSVLAARDGSVWAATAGWLWVLRPKAQRFERTRERALDRARIFQARDGRIWLSPGGSLPIHAIADALQPPGLGVSPMAPVAPGVEGSGEQLWVDRDNVFWGARRGGGIFRIAPARHGTGSTDLPIERFTLADGLSSDIASPLLEDREGNIWVGTNLGLDRFRATNAIAASGLPTTSRQGFQAAADKDGAVFVVTGDRLFKVRPDRNAEVITRLEQRPRSIHVDRAGSVWIGFDRGIARLDGTRLRFVTLHGGASGAVFGWLETPGGLLCASVLGQGIYCDSPTGWVRAPAPLGTLQRAPIQMIADNANRLWLNYEDQLVMLDGAQRRVFEAKQDLAIGSIEIVTALDDKVYALGDFGLAWFDGRRFRTLRSDRHPALSRISGIAKGADGAIWLNGLKGVVRIQPADLASAFAGPDGDLRATLFDLDDGLPGVAQQDSNTPTVISASDGRLWFVTSHGVASIDPRNLSQNPLPPPVSIVRLVAGGQSFAGLATIELPAGTSSFQIDYAALSLSIPERVRFRYQLETVDPGWVDPGRRRQAFYTGLGPGRYRFRVIAANNDGVWNDTGATLTVIIPPTFLQSIWFKIMIAGALLAGAWWLYSMRMRQIAATIRLQLEERLRERERIARELHDTLLQGFQGLVYRFQSAINQLPKSHRARADLEEALDLADVALAEGRDRVRNLRTGPVDDHDVAQHFANIAAQSDAANGGAFQIVTEGRPRALQPVVRTEIFRIGDEAILNAIRHSRAQKTVVNIVYHPREFRLHIDDDGIGIAPDLIEQGGRHNHFGMIGMRERAEVIRGRFSIASRPGSGTQVTLSVPASIAYLQKGKRKRLFGCRALLGK